MVLVDNLKHVDNKKLAQNLIEMVLIHCSNGGNLSDYFNQYHKHY
jgi:hypothetical protein